MYSKLINYALTLVRTLHDAEDVVQEAYLRMLSRPKTLTIVNQQAYLKKTIVNIVRDQCKSASHRLHAELPEDYDVEYHSEMLISSNDDMHEKYGDFLRSVLDNREDRELLTQKYVDGAPSKTMALKLGLTKAALDMRLSRLKAKIRCKSLCS